MAGKAREQTPKPAAKTGREARLKAALKANMAKRKAQAGKRAQKGGTGGE